MTEAVVLTCLPNGHDSQGHARITIFVTPRLTVPGATAEYLSAFPTFAIWPDAANKLLEQGVLAVLVEDTDPQPGTPAKEIGILGLSSDTPDNILWSRLFKANTVKVYPPNSGPDEPATGFRDLSGQKVRSFPAADVAAQIASLYNSVASTSPTSFPSVKDNVLKGLLDLGAVSLDPVPTYDKIDAGFRSGHQDPDKKSGFYHPEDTPAVDSNLLPFILARRFYDRPAGIKDLPEKTPPVIDFHGYISFLGDYPMLLRRLGLAMDLDLDVQLKDLPERGRMRLNVHPTATTPGLADKEGARPWTNYKIDGKRFTSRPRVGEGYIDDGSLLFDHQSRFAVLQLDVDGGALKTFDFAGTVKRITDTLAAGNPPMTPAEASLPALRTGGFVIVQQKRDQAVVDQFGKSADHEDDRLNDTAANLFAEDVTRGYRPHVQRTDAAGPWWSLTLRDGRYVIGTGSSATVLKESDEGFVKGASTTSALDGSDDDLYLHEAVFGWDGWSLAVKRPGNAILDSAGAKVELPAPPGDKNVPLVTTFTVPDGKLPRLRFGREYRFRALAVDLAGNSVPEADLANHETDKHTFHRWDPVPSPAIIPRRRFTEGESLTRLVIRSTLGVSPAAYVAQARITALPQHTHPDTAYLVENRRWIAPPKASVQLVEWHSELDKGIGKDVSGENLDWAFDTAARESGSYIDPGTGAAIVTNDQAVPPKAVTADMKGKALDPGEYVIRDTDNLGMPYLPDPASEGASFTTLPGGPKTTMVAWRGPGWPDLWPIELRIVDGGLTTDPPTAPKPDGGIQTKVLTVALRQAEMVTVRLSSYPTDEGVKVSAILAPLTLGPQEASDAYGGRNWLLTPFEEITLVHAVEMPLAPPVVKVTDAGVQRYEGETFAALGGTIQNHAKSTGRLDVDGEWTDAIDDPLKPAPEDKDNLGEVRGFGHAGDFTLEATEDSCHVGRDDAAGTPTSAAVHKLRHEFRDTKHRVVTYKAKATTRFREYFPATITDDLALITNPGPPTTVRIPSSRRPDPPDVQYVIPTFRWVDDVFPGLPAGTSIDEVEPRIARTLKNVRGVRVLLDRGIRAERLSSRVRLPLVRRRVRRAGLRVYLNRPWYSSGADELLAVVLPDQPYLLWYLDLTKGLVVDAMSRALADQAAEHLLGQELIRAAGSQRLRPSERLAQGVRAMRPPQEALDQPLEAERLLTDYQVGLVGDALINLPDLILMPSGGDPEKFVTRFGADPIWGSDPPATGPWIHQFPLRTQVGTGLKLAEAPDSTVAVVGHKPRFDKDRKLWYCDIDIDAGTSYFPFVRLGLARYQYSSIKGVELSRVVSPEWAQLLPDRTATIGRPRPDVARVTLRGPAGWSNIATQVYGQAGGGSAAGLDLSRFAVAQVERRPAKATTDLAWRTAGPEVRLDLKIRTAYSDIEYSGAVEVPQAAAGEQLRVTLREYEVLESDVSQADETVIVPGEHIDLSYGLPGYNLPPSAKGVRFRLVYASQLEL